MAVAGPDTDLGNVETALEALTDSCYYLTSERNRYYFSLKENLNKRYADRRASVRDTDIEGRIKEEIQKVVSATDGIDRKFFPDQSAQIPDVPSITFVILSPEHSIQDDDDVMAWIASMTREYGKSARTYKSGLVFIVAEAAAPLREEARKHLAWEDIRDEGLKLDDAQRKQLSTNVDKSRRDLTESVWRSYKNVVLLGKDNQLQTIDLGLVTSSAAETFPKHVLARLRQNGEIEKEISPRFLVRNWPPAFTEWSTKSVRDSFYASPQFPRLLDSETIRGTIARGVREGHLAYGSKNAQGIYDELLFQTNLDAAGVEIEDDVYVLTPEEAQKHIEPPRLEKLLVNPESVQLRPGTTQTFVVEGVDQFGGAIGVPQVDWTATGGAIEPNGVFEAANDEGSFLVTASALGKAATASVSIATVEAEPKPKTPKAKTKLVWSGEVAPQKWSQLYMKVLTKLVSSGDVRLDVTIEATPTDGVTDQQVEDTKAALRGLGIDDSVKVE